MSLNTRDYTVILWILQWTLCEAMMLISPRLTWIVSWKLIVHLATAVTIMSARLFMTHVWQFFLLHWMLICWWHKTTNRSTSDFNILTHEMNCDLKYTILYSKIYWLLLKIQPALTLSLEQPRKTTHFVSFTLQTLQCCYIV